MPSLTKYVIYVLSEDDNYDPGENEVEVEREIAQIAYDITEGDCVGVFRKEYTQPLSYKVLAKKAYEFGSHPKFFGIDDKGEKLDGSQADQQLSHGADSRE